MEMKSFLIKHRWAIIALLSGLLLGLFVAFTYQQNEISKLEKEISKHQIETAKLQGSFIQVEVFESIFNRFDSLENTIKKNHFQQLKVIYDEKDKALRRVRVMDVHAQQQWWDDTFKPE
jgi:Rps23 Pro-64 3,4-dihydroxylase Tpa1-like proline 4-hydroxylase